MTNTLFTLTCQLKKGKKIQRGKKKREWQSSMSLPSRVAASLTLWSQARPVAATSRTAATSDAIRICEVACVCEQPCFAAARFK